MLQFNCGVSMLINVKSKHGCYSRMKSQFSSYEDNNTWQWLSYESSIHRAKEEISLKSLVFSFALIFNNLWKTKDSLSYNRSQLNILAQILAFQVITLKACKSQGFHVFGQKELLLDILDHFMVKQLFIATLPHFCSLLVAKQGNLQEIEGFPRKRAVLAAIYKNMLIS